MSCLSAAASCSSTGGNTAPPGGSGGSSGAAGGSGAGKSGSSGQTSGTLGGSGVGGSGVTSGAVTGSATGGAGASSGEGSGAAGESGASSGAILDAGADVAQGPYDSGLAIFDAAGRTLPTCAKPTPPPNDVGGAMGSRPGECDFPVQSLDFEDSLGYPSSAATIKVTDFGQSFGLYEINNCSPYCYAKNLTVGIDIVGGTDPSKLQGEIIVEFPSAGIGLPITTVAMRNSLAWITFDGATKPPFEIDTQMVVETTTGIVPAVEVQQFFAANGPHNPFGPFNVANNYSYNNGCEFKYFPITTASGYPNGLMNVTGMGFRIVAKAAAGQEWHGVAYIDHMYIRNDNAPNGDWPAEAGGNSNDYPFGLF
jgi:hypothetical protein